MSMDYAARARQVRREIQAIPYDVSDGEGKYLKVVELALQEAYEAGVDGAREAMRSRRVIAPVRINGNPINGRLTDFVFVSDDEQGDWYDITVEFEPDTRPIPKSTGPHLYLEMPAPEGATLSVMTTAAESIRQLAKRIEARANNDLATAAKLRGIL